MMRLLGVMMLFCLPWAAPAQGFEPSDAELLEGWPGLETDQTEPGAEIRVYAIVERGSFGPQSLYVVVHDNHRFVNVLGAMVCNTRFEALASQGNGARDILCGNDWGSMVYVLGADGMYRPQ